MNYEIIHLPKEQWKGTSLPVKYTADQFYDVSVNPTATGFSIDIGKEDFPEPMVRGSQDQGFPDRLYEEYRQNAYAWGILSNGELIAALETDPENWSNRLRITELWVAEPYQRQGIGHALIEVAKEQAARERRRAIILETQSCNVTAVDFYLHEGFQLIGLDTCCYGNDDLKRKEVRLELGWFPKEKKKLQPEELEIRKETADDRCSVELMTQHAFWNKYQPGCVEHYLVSKLRQHPDYLPELSRIAVKDGIVIGCIMYSKSRVIFGSEAHEVITFGPLCVEPEWQGCGVGEMLLRETMRSAAAEGYPGIIIYGEPDYYPRFGFKSCDQYNITTADGKNFEAFMGIELTEGSFGNIKGRFLASEVFEHLPADEIEEFNKKFPPLQKLKFPGQFA